MMYVPETAAVNPSLPLEFGVDDMLGGKSRDRAKKRVEVKRQILLRSTIGGPRYVVTQQRCLT